MLGHLFPACQTPSGLRRGLGFKITAMSSENQPYAIHKKRMRNPKILCLHGFRTSGRIFQAQISKWPESILQNVDLDFLDGPFPAAGKSVVEGFFDPPYYEWYQSSKGFTAYRNFEECLAYIEDYMIRHGPFDGLLGFSQGAFLSAAIPGMQEKGKALTKVPKIKFLVIISGAKFPGLRFGQPKAAIDAFSSLILCPSLHFIGKKQEQATSAQGERDFLKTEGEVLVESFIEPVVIHHPRGHTIPKLETKAEETMLSFFNRIKQLLNDESCSCK